MQDKYPTDIFETNKTFLKIAGLWFPKKEDSFKKWLAYTLQTCIYLTNCALWFCLSEMSEMRHTYKNKSIFIEHLGRIILHILASIKVVNFCLRKKQIFDIMNALESSEFRYRATSNFKPGLHFQKSKDFLFKMSWSFLFFTTVVPISYYCTTFFQFIYKITPEQFTEGNVTCSSFLPYHSLVPFPVRTKMSCGFGIGYQFITALWYTWQIAGKFLQIRYFVIVYIYSIFLAHDTLLAAILVYLKSHFVTAREAFESIKPRSQMELGLSETKNKRNKDNIKVIQQMDFEMTKSTKDLETIIA